MWLLCLGLDPCWDVYLPKRGGEESSDDECQGGMVQGVHRIRWCWFHQATKTTRLKLLNDRCLTRNVRDVEIRAQTTVF